MSITPEGSIIWETELFNNDSYAASANSITTDGKNLFVTGDLEMRINEQLLVNSYAAGLDLTGRNVDKEYLENSNSGSDIALDSSGNLVVLNQNCLILSQVPVPFDNTCERYRVLEVCDSYNTDIKGSGLSITSTGDFLIAGQKGGNFYYALKSGPGE